MLREERKNVYKTKSERGLRKERECGIFFDIKPMRLSVIIPTKNEERWLPRLLESLKMQTIQPYEVIVADANSTDRTRAVAASFGARVVDGGMPSVGRNRGAQAAQGEMLLFLDADAVMRHPKFLEDNLRELAERHLLLATCYLEPDNQGFLGLIDRTLYAFYNQYAVSLERRWPHAVGSCIFVDRIMHERAKGFDEGLVFAEDMEYVRRVADVGCRFGILRAHPLFISMRRLDKEGRARLIVKYVYAEWHLFTQGPFREALPFSYEMGSYSEKEGCVDSLDARPPGKV